MPTASSSSHSLAKDLPSQFERPVKSSRDLAENAAVALVRQLAIGYDAKGLQRHAWHVGYEHWQRILLASFLVENELLCRPVFKVNRINDYQLTRANKEAARAAAGWS